MVLLSSTCFQNILALLHRHVIARPGGLTWVEVSDALAVVSPIWQLLFEVLCPILACQGNVKHVSDFVDVDEMNESTLYFFDKYRKLSSQLWTIGLALWTMHSSRLVRSKTLKLYAVIDEFRVLNCRRGFAFDRHYRKLAVVHFQL